MRYSVDRDQIETTAEELCNIALRTGDIDSRAPHSRGTERSLEALRKKLYGAQGALYHSEVTLRNTSCLDGIYFCVTGVADGIQCTDGEYTVDGAITDASRFFCLRCCAYFLCRTKELDGVRVRCCTSRDGELVYSERYYTEQELKAEYIAALTHALPEARLLVEKEKERRASAASAVFPYSGLRESQEEMIRECYRDIKHKSRLFCQAPTGIGKTVSTLFPSVKCFGEGYADRIFYLTSKASIKREAYHAVQRMNAAGTAVRACVLSSRESMCLCDGAKRGGGRLSSHCNPDACPYAKGYYDRAREAVFRFASSSYTLDSGAIKAFGKAEMLCPYELSLDLSELCDVIICDYNYVFSPTVYLRRYFDEPRRKDEKYVFLVDEAHNLPDRARDMYSAALRVSDFEAVIASAPEDSTLSHACISALRSIEELELLCKDNLSYDPDGNFVGYYVSRSMPEKLESALSEFAKKCDQWLHVNTDTPLYRAAEELAFKVYEFRKIAERFDRGYLTFVNKSARDLSVLLYCLDPSDQLSRVLERAVASVMFSATLTPTDYFAEILGGGGKAVSVSFRSPFPPENLCVAAVDKISTRFEDREASYGRVASSIAATVSARAGNYMVFFPSYSYLEEVKKRFCAKYPKVKVLSQSKNMTAREREEFLASFKDDEGKLRIGFCVLGGSFSEGIDLPGNRLIGVVVVGVGLPGISNENNIIRDYYEEKCGQGYDYAYTYPGMNGVLQAVGRVIRTETDRGIAVLIDDRYADPKYRSLFPHEWKGMKFAGNSASLAEIARRFWKNEE